MNRTFLSLVIIGFVCVLFARDDVDILKVANWSASADSLGSTATVTTGDVVKADFNQVAQPDPNTWPWVSLLAEVAPIGDNLQGVTTIKVTYKCEVDVYVRLPQPPLSTTGESYRKQISSASSLTTENLAIADFAQPDWVTTTTPLDLSKVLGVEFVPVIPVAGGTATLELTELVLSGFITPIVTNTHKTSSNVLSIGRITHERITFSVPKNGAYSLSVFAVNGQRHNVIYNSYFSKGINAVDWNGKTISDGMYVFLLYNDGNSAAKRIILK